MTKKVKLRKNKACDYCGIVIPKGEYALYGEYKYFSEGVVFFSRYYLCHKVDKCAYSVMKATEEYYPEYWVKNLGSCCDRYPKVNEKGNLYTFFGEQK